MGDILDGLDCILANVYIPPSFFAEVPKILMSFLASHPNVPALIVGDFNNYLDFELDKFTQAHSRQTPAGGPTPFANLLAEMGLHGCMADKKSS